MILHLSDTTLSGAPAMLAAAQRRAGLKAVYLQFGDNSHSRLSVSPDPIAPKLAKDWMSILCMLVRAARVIHIHNRLPQNVEELVSGCNSDRHALCVWHLHQGSFERPIFLPLGMGIKFDKLAVVPHGFDRTLPDFTPLPNCLYREASEQLGRRLIFEAKSHEKISIIFSPSNKGGARWSRKFNQRFKGDLDELTRNAALRVHVATDEHAGSLLFRRATFDITIDEIVTGGYHLVSYEGLASANVVVNGADWLSRASFRAAFQVERDPPFAYAEPETFPEVIAELISDRSKITSIQQESFDYFESYMRHPRIVGIYNDFYGLK